MGIIKPIRIPVSQCNGAMLRWYYNGWHHYTFNNRYQLIDTPTTYDTQVTEEFSAISRVEIPTGKSIKQSIEFGEQGMKSETFEGVKGLMLAEVAEIYIEGFWFPLEVERTSYKVRVNDQNAYDIVFKSEIKDGQELIKNILVKPEEEKIILYEDFESLPNGWRAVIYAGGTVTAETIESDQYIVLTSTSTQYSSASYIKDISPFYGVIKITCNVIVEGVNSIGACGIYLARENGVIFSQFLPTTSGEKTWQYTVIASEKIKQIRINRSGGAGVFKLSYIKIEKL
jgi:uncharacterized protein YbdZ (MbtH family)